MNYQEFYKKSQEAIKIMQAISSSLDACYERHTLAEEHQNLKAA